MIYIYDVSGAPIGMAYRDSTYSSGAFDFYLFAKNIQGDILYIYNTSGTRLVTYTYDAWGKCYVTYQNGGASTAARYNPFRYRGYYYDTETGFYYLNSRYYDPAVGRFLNADGYINANGDILGFNMFAYCSNNPVNKFDPNGELWWLTTLVIIGACVTISLIAELNMPSKEEHYSRNNNNTIDIPENVEDVPADWKTSDVQKYPGSEQGPAANAHNFTSENRDNVKFVSPDGKMEAIYDFNGKFVTDPRDIGTYNFCPSEKSIIGHYVKDIKPWIRWGNGADDTTTPWQRMWGLLGVY